MALQKLEFSLGGHSNNSAAALTPNYPPRQSSAGSCNPTSRNCSNAKTIKVNSINVNLPRRNTTKAIWSLKLSSGNIRKVWATFVGERQWGSNLNVGMHRAIQRRDLQEQSSGHRGVFSPQMHECLRTPLLFFLLSDPCVMSIVWIIHISHSQRIVSCV